MAGSARKKSRRTAFVFQSPRPIRECAQLTPSPDWLEMDSLTLKDECVVPTHTPVSVPTSQDLSDLGDLRNALSIPGWDRPGGYRMESATCGTPRNALILGSTF